MGVPRVAAKRRYLRWQHSARSATLTLDAQSSGRDRRSRGASIANTTAKPSGVKRYFAGPSRNTTEVKTQSDGERRHQRRHGDAGRLHAVSLLNYLCGAVDAYEQITNAWRLFKTMDEAGKVPSHCPQC